MIFPLMYNVSDFLLDQKDHLNRLDALYKKATTEARRIEIQEQREYIYNQGLQALRRYSGQLPDSVRQYYLEDEARPETDQIVQESHDISEMHRKSNRTISCAVVAFLVIVLFLRDFIRIWLTKFFFLQR